jgi:hypothetical protein
MTEKDITYHETTLHAAPYFEIVCDRHFLFVAEEVYYCQSDAFQLHDTVSKFNYIDRPTDLNSY